MTFLISDYTKMSFVQRTRWGLVWGPVLSKYYERRGFSWQSLDHYRRPGMPFSKDVIISLFYEPPEYRRGSLLTGRRDRRSPREVEIDIASRALTALFEGWQLPLEVFTNFFLHLPPRFFFYVLEKPEAQEREKQNWYKAVADELFEKRKWWSDPKVQSPLSYLHKIAKQRKALRDQQEAEAGISNEVVSLNPDDPPFDPFWRDLVPRRFEAYGIDPPEYSSTPPPEISLEPERIPKILRKQRIPADALELLTVYANSSCKSFSEVAEILNWPKSRLKRALKQLERLREPIKS